MLNSLTGEGFDNWVQMQKRVHREAQQEAETLELDPDVHAAW